MAYSTEQSEQRHDEPTPRDYLIVFAALIGLLVLTVAAAFLDLGRWGVAVALGIATVKALLIMLYFMHVKSGPRTAKAFAGAGFLWLGILIVLTFADYLTRNHPPGMNYRGEPHYIAGSEPPSQP